MKTSDLIRELRVMCKNPHSSNLDLASHVPQLLDRLERLECCLEEIQLCCGEWDGEMPGDWIEMIGDKARAALSENEGEK